MFYNLVKYLICWGFNGRMKDSYADLCVKYSDCY